MNSFIVVTEKDWEKATTDRRSWMIFNTLRALENRIKNLERPSSTKNNVTSFFGGVVGGALAVWTYLGIKAIK